MFKVFLLLVLTIDCSYANNVLAEVTSRLTKTPITQGRFQQEKQLKFLHKPLLSTGVFTYDLNKGVIWKTATPVPSILLMNEALLLNQQGKQALPPGFGRVFKALLSSDLKYLSEDFKISGQAQKTAWQLQLTPKDELLKKIIKTILLTGDTELRLMELQETSGNLSRIQFSDITHPDHLTTEQQADFERLSP